MPFNADLFYNTIIPLGVGAWAIFIGIILFILIRNKGKIKINLKTDFLQKTVWKKPYTELDGKTYVTIQKENKRKNLPFWKTEITSKGKFAFIDKLGRIKFCIDVYYGAPKNIEYDFRSQAISESFFTLEILEKASNAKILEYTGKPEKTILPSIFWIVVILGIIDTFLLFLMFIAPRGF